MSSTKNITSIASFKKWILSTLLFVLVPFLSFSQVIYSNTFTGTGACPTQGNTPVVASNATGTVVSRSNSLSCDEGADVFNTKNLNNTASVNDASYIEFSVTPNADAKLSVTSLSFFRQASPSAPNQLEVRYSTNSFATSTSWGAVPLTPVTGTSTGGSTITWDFTDFSVPPSATLTFRFYPYGTQRADLATGASNGTVGTFRLDNITLNGTSPLPVNLVSFAGKSRPKGITINWVTAWEEENQGFDIQKSTNAKSFETVGAVDGKYNTQVQSVYEFIDPNVAPGQIYYYRLKQKDTGGTSTLSQIIVVRVDGAEQGNENVIAPNPNKGNFSVLGQKSMPANLTLYNPSGLEVPIQTEQGASRDAFNVQTRTCLSPGVYYLHIKPTDGSGTKALKVLVEP